LKVVVLLHLLLIIKKDHFIQFPVKFIEAL